MRAQTPTISRLPLLASALLICGALAFGACSSDDGASPEEGATAVIVGSGPIGPAGGTVDSSDGALSLAFPAGAVEASTHITVRVREGAAAAGLVTAIYDLEPDGLQFTEPVTLTLGVADPPADADLELRNADTGEVVEASTWDAGTAKLSGLLRHFSAYGGFRVVQAYDPCGGKTCGETCTLCAPSDSDCSETGVEKFCDAEGACVTAVERCDGPDPVPAYEPCADKACGDRCTVCDPADDGCAETAVEKACRADGTCAAGEASCGADPPPYEPCADKACGDQCFICAPDDADCAETAVVKSCQIDGSCSAEAAQCGGTDPPVYEPCGGKACGDQCFICAPDDAGCAETAVVKVCHPDGSCSAQMARCDEPDPYDPCENKKCGDSCTLCDPNDTGCAENRALKTCRADGTCAIGTAQCDAAPYDPCGGKSCGDQCWICPPDDADCAETAVVKTCHPDGSCNAQAAQCDEPTPYDACADKACGDACTVCAPDDADCVETDEVKTCDAEGTCSSGQATCDEPQFCGGIAGFQCPAGFECVDDPRDDCHPDHGGADCGGICVEEEERQFCGGFAGIQCPDGQTCVDDPSDDCDPNHGGADCGGVCVDDRDAYEPCKGKACGDRCTICPPGDPDCFETAVVKSCHPDGSCQASVPACEE